MLVVHEWVRGDEEAIVWKYLGICLEKLNINTVQYPDSNWMR
jgi:hypothetical protein